MLTPPGAPQRAPNEDPPFVTSSLPLSAFLSARGHNPDLRLNEESSRAVFIFPVSPALRKDLAAYQDGSATVAPAAYESARVGLLNRISALRGGAR